MFGYELTDTLCVFCANELHILTSKKKADFLRPLEPALKKRSDLPDLRIHMRNKVCHFVLNTKELNSVFLLTVAML